MPNPARSRGRKVNAGQALALLLSFVLVAVVGGVLAAGLILPGAAVAKGVTNMTTETFDELPTELAESSLPQKSTILAADGKTVLATFYDEDREVVGIDDIAPIMQDAVIATEDKRFYEHAGIDPTGMLRAAAKGALSDSKEGASTLTQQYIKNVLIEQALNKPTEAERKAALEDARGADGTEGVARKLREAKLAISLEQKWSKKEILEKYLNIAQFGINLYGVETAAQKYFSTSAKKLNYLQAATIAGITRSPTAWDPTRNPKDSQDRRDTVLKLMEQQGYITTAEYDKGIATPLKDTLKVQTSTRGCMASASAVAGSGFFCDYVTKVVANDMKSLGKTRADRLAALNRGGLTIKTTIIPKEQKAADKQVKKGVPVKDKTGIGSSIVVVEPGTGKITAMAENRVYNNTSEHGKRETAVNWNADNEYGSASGFPPGSTFKPFTLLQWLKDGHSLNDRIDGRLRKDYNTDQFTACGAKLPSSKWNLHNSEGQGGFMTVQDATKNSVNSGYAEMGKQLDLCDIMKGASELGVHKAGGAAGTGDFDPFPANIIGSQSVAPLTMANAFAAFASGGIYCDPIAISTVTNASGKKFKVPSANCHRELESRIANAMNEGLSHVWEGTAKGVAKPSFATAGKTGTTSENEDTWFVGYTPARSAAVWVGYPNEFKPMKDVTVAGTYIRRMYGSSIAAPTWSRFMTSIRKGEDNPDFTKAGSDELYGKKVYVPYVVGRSAGDAKAILESAGFKVSIDTTPVASDKPAGTVASQSPSGSAPKNTYISLQISDGSQVKPPENQDQNNQDGQNQNPKPGQNDGGKGNGKDKGGPGKR
ncbi:penicillin-binding protein [Cellulomonas sp. JH27-2]|uniref:transglycosylase domain-containing protein n=1 Tax=Cellulomonas sp. JH27-2 TaxID=2774139 RepID=UPI001782EFC2|nr:transglycosylase domain-containing protein [Cellulomonas sp. JH27-2]MBD8057764.1 penicillin-binding protein [Cellulomonas sp. JH27-2]